MTGLVEQETHYLTNLHFGENVPLKLLRDLVLVKPEERKLSDVIHVKNTEKFNEGVIVSVGRDVVDVKAGDKIKYGNGTYLDWPLYDFDGVFYQIIQEADIACVVEQ